MLRPVLRPIQVELNGSTKVHQNYQAIVNPVDEEVFAIAKGGDYNLVYHEDLLERVLSSFSRIPELRNYKKVRNVVGKKLIQVFTFPDTYQEINNEPICLAIRVTNSYDMTLAISASVFGWREACLNELSTCNEVFRCYSRHASGFSYSLVSKLPNAVASFQEEAEHWKEWVEVPVTDEQVTKLVDGCFASKKLIDDALTNYESYAENVWSVFQAVTETTTHAMEPYTSLRNQYRVNRTFKNYENIIKE